MRVIAGKYRSRTLGAPRGRDTRPTSDRLRESLMNVLAPRLEGSRFADLYAGSGAVGIEALSRGAAFCLFAERAPTALAALRGNLHLLGITGGTVIDTRPVARGLADGFRQSVAFDLIFLDPPYEAVEDYHATLQSLGRTGGRLLHAESLVIAEHARRHRLQDRYASLGRSRVLEQGDSALSFFTLDSFLEIQDRELDQEAR